MDIVVTIPKSEYENDDKETEYLASYQSSYQFWTLRSRPKNLHEGDRVYFIKNNQIESSMKFIYDTNDEIMCDVTGRLYWGYKICMNDLRKENIPLKVKGFQGFRYRWWSID